MDQETKKSVLLETNSPSARSFWFPLAAKNVNRKLYTHNWLQLSIKTRSASLKLAPLSNQIGLLLNHPPHTHTLRGTQNIIVVPDPKAILYVWERQAKHFECVCVCEDKTTGVGDVLSPKFFLGLQPHRNRNHCKHDITNTCHIQSIQPTSKIYIDAITFLNMQRAWFAWSGVVWGTYV